MSPIDGTVKATVQGDEMDPIQAGVYIIDLQNQAHGSYGQSGGQTVYIKSVWLPLSQGRLKSGVYGLPPIDASGNFFAFIGYNFLVNRW